MLAAPLCWFHYMLVLVPFLMAVQWNRWQAAGALILWAPVTLPLLSLRGPLPLQATLGGFYMAGLLLVAAGWMRTQRRAQF